jgi:formate hydrogenlyase transcriptional activator
MVGIIYCHGLDSLVLGQGRRVAAKRKNTPILGPLARLGWERDPSQTGFLLIPKNNGRQRSRSCRLFGINLGGAGMEQSASSVVGQSLPLRLPADRARVLLEINNAVVSHLDLAQVLKSVSACLRREIKHDFAALALYNPERHELRLHALDFPNDPTFLKQGQLIPLVGTPAALAFSSRKTVLRHRPDFNEFTADIMKLAYARGIRSGCAVPLICHDKIVGSMALASLRESAFTEDDAELLTQIGTQVAIAVDNAQSFEKTRLAQHQMERERDRSKLLLEVNNAVVSHLNLSDLLTSISARLQEVMFNDSSFIALCGPENTLETLALDLGKLENVAFKEGRRMPMEGTPEEQAIRTGRPVLVRSVAEFARFPSWWVGYAIDHGIKSGCFNPLIAHGRTLGALGVVSLREDAFTPDSARLLEDISGQIAIAVENALNFQKAHQAEQAAKRERDRSKLLLDINNALVSHLDLNELVRAISNSLQSVVSNECVALAIYDSETDKLFAQAVSSVIDPMPEGIYYDPEGTTSGLVFKSGKPLYLPRPDYESFPSPATHGFFKSGLKSLYSMPISIHGRKIGVMSISSIREDAFTKEDQEVFLQIANQVAIAAANSLAVRDLETLKNKLAQEKLYLEDEIRNELNFDEIVGQSPALKQVLKLVETVAASDSTVLLLGETGTGKELIARAVHEHSRRKSRTFVKLNCAAIPTGLLESELFGHEKGPFTGAIAQKIGRLELADQGTLFLDEVGDIPVEIQPKLLRALQEREFERLGSTHTKKVNVRLVAATNRNLEKMIEERQFRGDLYYRLNVFPIQIPPLRERQEDIPLLVRYFAEKFARQMQKPIDSIPTQTMSKLQKWHWPGNIRELENLIERAVILTTGTALQVPLPEIKSSTVSVPNVSPSPSDQDDDREQIIKILRQTGGMLGGPKGAAARLGIKRTTLQYKIKKFGITRNHWWPPNLQT